MQANIDQIRKLMSRFNKSVSQIVSVKEQLDFHIFSLIVHILVKSGIFKTSVHEIWIWILNSHFQGLEGNLYTFRFSVIHWIGSNNRVRIVAYDLNAALNAPTPAQKLKSWFPTLSSQEIVLSWVLLKMIFEVLQSELLEFKFHSPKSKIREFSL